MKPTLFRMTIGAAAIAMTGWMMGCPEMDDPGDPVQPGTPQQRDTYTPPPQQDTYTPPAQQDPLDQPGQQQDQFGQPGQQDQLDQPGQQQDQFQQPADDLDQPQDDTTTPGAGGGM